jgi:hypothetical protein
VATLLVNQQVAAIRAKAGDSGRRVYIISSGSAVLVPFNIFLQHAAYGVGT